MRVHVACSHVANPRPPAQDFVHPAYPNQAGELEQPAPGSIFRTRQKRETCLVEAERTMHDTALMETLAAVCDAFLPMIICLWLVL